MIKVRVVDTQALAARSPADLSMYLRAKGWQLAERNGTLAHWTLAAGDEGEFEVLQPLDPGSRDYAARIGDAVATLAASEDCSELDVLRAITEVSQELMDFLRTIRIGPAAEGSYTLTVHTPVPPRLGQQPSLFDSEPGEWPEE